MREMEYTSTSTSIHTLQISCLIFQTLYERWSIHPHQRQYTHLRYPVLHHFRHCMGEGVYIHININTHTSDILSYISDIVWEMEYTSTSASTHTPQISCLIFQTLYGRWSIHPHQHQYTHLRYPVLYFRHCMRDGVYIHISVNTHTSDILSYISDIVWEMEYTFTSTLIHTPQISCLIFQTLYERWSIYPHQHQYTHLRYPVLYFRHCMRDGVYIHININTHTSDILFYISDIVWEMEYTSTSTSIHTLQISCLIFQTLYERWSIHPHQHQYTHLRYPVLYFRHCMRDEVYIHINVNTHTSDILSYISDIVWEMEYTSTSTSIHTPQISCLIFQTLYERWSIHPHQCQYTHLRYPFLYLRDGVYIHINVSTHTSDILSYISEMEYTSISTSIHTPQISCLTCVFQTLYGRKDNTHTIHTPQISCLIFQTLYEGDGVYIHINVNTHTSNILSYISDIVWDRWSLHSYQHQYTHLRYPVLYFRHCMREMEYTSTSTSTHTLQISCLIFQTLYGRHGVYIHINVNTHTSNILSYISDIVWDRWSLHSYQRQYTHLRYPVLYFRHCMREMEYTSTSTLIHTSEISCLIFQTLYERDGVYIHINVNTHTSDILSYISDIVWERWSIHPHQRQYTHFG